MILIEIPREALPDAQRIAAQAEQATIIPAQQSYEVMELNDLIQIGIQLASYAIPAVALIVVEMIKAKKNLKIKISKDSFEAEGREEEVLALVEKYLQQQKEAEAVQAVEQLLALDAPKPTPCGESASEG